MNLVNWENSYEYNVTKAQQTHIGDLDPTEVLTMALML